MEKDLKDKPGMGEEEESFAELFEKSYRQEERLKPGQLVEGGGKEGVWEGRELFHESSGLGVICHWALAQGRCALAGGTGQCGHLSLGLC